MAKGKKNKGGRPTVFTKEVVDKLEQAFSNGATIEMACFYAGIHRDSYYDYIKRNPKFSDRVEDLRSKPILKALNTVVNSLTNTEDAKWYLERRFKKEYSPRQEVSVEAEVKMSKIDDVIKATQEILKKK